MITNDNMSSIQTQLEVCVEGNTVKVRRKGSPTVGQRFGRYEVIEKVSKKGEHNSYWLCRCDCGKENTVAAHDLNAWARQCPSCSYKGYVANKTITGAIYIPLIGQKINNYLVTSEVISKNKTERRWRCQCDCGNETIINTSTLNSRVNNCRKCRSNHRPSRKRPFEILFDNIKGNAKPRGLYVQITYEQFLKFTQIINCFYCGSRVIWTDYPSNDKPFYPSNLDRKDSMKGYQEDNIVVCCPLCNKAKNNFFTCDEFLVMMQALLLYKIKNTNSISKKYQILQKLYSRSGKEVLTKVV